MQKIKIGIVGGAGYTGGELIRILINHPNADIQFIHSKSSSGQLVSNIHTDLFFLDNVFFTDTLNLNIDVLFLCLGHNESKLFLEKNEIPDTIKIIDLSQDFRLKNNQQFLQKKFVYGLPELNKNEIYEAMNIANPGCFATAIQLSLLPLAKANLLKDVFISGTTGSTGAGQSLSQTNHFSWRANNVQPYKTLTHQHLKEITESLQQLQNIEIGEINFIPYRGNFTRGIIVSSVVECNEDIDYINNLYTKYYQESPFVYIAKQMIDLKQVVNSNYCLLFIEKENNKIIVHAVIDNLLKGAVGQAVQNMNLCMGLPETIGLNLKANFF